MKQIKMNYATPCFSGCCGFCVECCDSSIEPKILDKQNQEGALCKIVGKQRMNEIQDEYTNELRDWCQSRGYRNPSDIGWTKEIMKLNEDKYKLSRKLNKDVCDDPFCKAIYLTMHEHSRKSFYESMPLYFRDKKFEGDHFKLCGPCISKYFY